MPAIEIGRICVKTSGRETGRKCVIVDLADKSFAVVTGPKSATGVKRRRANINHLEILQDRIEINRGASDEEVTQALKASGKLESMTQTTGPALV